MVLQSAYSFWAMYLLFLWGCPQLWKRWKANHHPQKDIYRVKRGEELWMLIIN